MTSITGYHAHLYYDENSIETARQVALQAEKLFSIQVGRLHEKPVGPHPMWSCQLAFMPETFGKLIPWLALERDGLTVFIHPITGDDLKDHTDHTIWMGSQQKLNLEIFKKEGKDEND